MPILMSLSTNSVICHFWVYFCWLSFLFLLGYSLLLGDFWLVSRRYKLYALCYHFSTSSNHTCLSELWILSPQLGETTGLCLWSFSLCPGLSLCYHRTHLVCFCSHRGFCPVLPNCLMSKNCCFKYFVWFSSCLRQESKSGHYYSSWWETNN